MNLYLINKD